MSYIAIILALIVGVVLYIITSFQNRKLKKTIAELSENMQDYENQLMQSLVAEYQLLDENYSNKFNIQKEDLVSTMKMMRDEKQKLAIEEAIVILQKQDSGWFDRHFAAGVPSSDLIEEIFKEKFVSNDERYIDYINEIRKDGDV